MHRTPQGRQARLTTILLSTLVVGASLAALAPPAAASSTLTVCASGCAYADVASALAAAASGDTVLVRPGTYVDSVVVSTPVTLCSGTAASAGCVPNAANVILQGDDAFVVSIAADDVTVRGFTLRNPSYVATGAVDPALVLVDGDRASLLDSTLTQPAAPLNAGESRATTSAVRFLSGDDAILAGNTMNGFVGALGAGATCASGPCKVFGIAAYGAGDGLTIDANDIRVLGTGLPASAIQVRDQDDLTITDNFLRVPGAPSGSAPLSIGIEIASAVDGALVEGNDVATGLLETPYGAYGVFGVFSHSTFHDNVLRTLQHGLMLRTSAVGANSVDGNYFFDNNQAILNYANATSIEGNRFYLGAAAIVLDSVLGGGSTGVVLRDNEFRNHTRTLAVTDTVVGTYVDARENDWGAYTATLIRARHDDASGTNDVDISCFIDADGTTRVCPSASFTGVATGTGWPKTFTLTDTSTSGGRTIDNRTWALPGGTFAYGPSVVLPRMPGAFAITLTVRDTEGFEDAATQTFTLANTAPSFTLPATMGATEGTPLQFTLSASDAEGDPLAYSMEEIGPEDAQFDTTTRTFSWTPDYTDDGLSFTLTFHVTDGASTTTQNTLVTVTDTPVPPVLFAIPGRSLLEGATLNAWVSAIDPDGGVPTLSATGLPAGATFTDFANGSARFTWAAPVGSSGTYTIPVTATAANLLTDTEDLVVTVTQRAGVALTAVSAFQQHTSPGQVVTVTARLRNSGTGPDTYALTTSNLGTGTAWAHSHSADPSLNAGSETLVTASATAPAAGGTTTLRLKACSGASPTTCQEVQWVLDTPLQLTIVMDAPTFTTLDTPSGVARVTWLNGAPVVGAALDLSQQSSGPVSVNSATSSVTNATGYGAFSFSGPRATLPGIHHVFGAAHWSGVADGRSEASYNGVLGV